MKQTSRNTRRRTKRNDHREVREFVRVIHLKLKNHKSQTKKAVSLYDMITK